MNSRASQADQAAGTLRVLAQPTCIYPNSFCITNFYSIIYLAFDILISSRYTINDIATHCESHLRFYDHLNLSLFCNVLVHCHTFPPPKASPAAWRSSLMGPLKVIPGEYTRPYCFNNRVPIVVLHLSTTPQHGKAKASLSSIISCRSLTHSIIHIKKDQRKRKRFTQGFHCSFYEDGTRTDPAALPSGPLFLPGTGRWLPASK